MVLYINIIGTARKIKYAGSNTLTFDFCQIHDEISLNLAL